MVGRRRKILRAIGWVFLGFFSLIAVICLLFYLNRGWIMDRAVGYLNESQPGKVKVEKINLIPFISFPGVAVQLKNVSYDEPSIPEDSIDREPILLLEEIFLSLDVIDLIRGDVKVSRAGLGDGYIRIELYEDSITNLEYALGFRFGKKDKKSKEPGFPSMAIDLDRLQMTNIQLVMVDRVRGHHVDLMVNSLENRFSYLPERTETGLKVDVDINSINYLTVSSEIKRNIQFESDVSFDALLKRITINPSLLKLSGLILEVWGSCDFLEEPCMDLGFRASNTGLDVLNFLLRGILDLDEIEQIGSGSIHLDGHVEGNVGKELPVIRVKGTADQIGFRIKSIKEDVTGISFRAFASSGEKRDLSEGMIQVEGFRANFQEGDMTGRFSVKNMVTPEVDVEVRSDIRLAGLEKMINTDAIADLKGRVKLEGRIRGVMDLGKSEFLNDAGSVTAVLDDVGFVMDRDTVDRMNGEVFVRENIIGTRNLELNINRNRIQLGVRVEDLLLYLLGFEKGVKADMTIASDHLYPAALFRDTSLVKLLGEEIRGLHFRAGAQIAKKELDAFLKSDSVPEMLLSLDSFGVELPLYADISNMNASLKFGPDTLDLYHLNGIVGESGFGFSGRVINYGALGREDPGAIIRMEYNLASGLMKAEDLFAFRDGFLLPETYRTEYLEDFRLAGSIMAPVSGLVDEDTPLNFDLNITDLAWNFRYYPLAFDQFIMNIRRDGDQVFVDDFRGQIGESNLKMKARIENITDSVENLAGSLVLESDLLDFNQLLNYQLPEDPGDSTVIDSAEIREPPRLDQIDYPRFSFTVDIDELRYGSYRIFGMKGSFRATREKIFYLDHMVTSGESGGQIEFNGQLNVSDPRYYTFSTELNLKEVNVKDLDFEMTSGEESYTLKENFEGLVSAKGLAEIFITPDLKFDMSTTTAVFDVSVTDGALINFTPLQAAAKYLDNKDLNHVRFASLRNRFTLADSRIMIPLMSVGSNIGQLLIEGEQGLDNSYLYLLRIPTWLVRDAARSVLTGNEDEQDEEKIYEMKMGKFLVLTAWSDGKASEVRTGDKRTRYSQ